MSITDQSWFYFYHAHEFLYLPGCQKCDENFLWKPCYETEVYAILTMNPSFYFITNQFLNFFIMQIH